MRLDSEQRSKGKGWLRFLQQEVEEQLEFQKIDLLNICWKSTQKKLLQSNHAIGASLNFSPVCEWQLNSNNFDFLEDSQKGFAAIINWTGASFDISQ